MSLEAGRKLGPYQVISPIGAGGMGEVYRARDTRLDRTVAIKILPAHRSSSPELQQRFEREARAISALSHPHICSLFDVGQDDGISYLVMEYLEGESLAARLTRGALPIAEMLRYSIEIGSALERAHRSNIAHRDLKPGNIVITKSGAKLVDFGLAKSYAEASLGDSATRRLPSADALTQDGTIVGTAPYMAPEQLEGKDADARSDIFAFGAVMYEMVTGLRAFPGANTASTIAAILNSHPAPASTVRAETPHALDPIIRTALEKDPDERWQSAHDIVAQLKRIASAEEVEEKTQRRPNRLLLFGGWATALAILAGVLFLIPRMRGDRADAGAAFLTIEPPPGITAPAAVITNDGQHIVLMGLTQDRKNTYWIRRVGERNYTEIKNLHGDSYAFTSPDGKEIAFVGNRQLKRRRIGSDRADVICDAPVFAGGEWLPDGTILFTPDFGSPVMRVPASGGTPVAVTDPPSKYGESLAGYPQLLPSGRLLYLARKSAGSDSTIYITDPRPGAPRKKVLDADAFLGFFDGFILYSIDSSLHAVPFDVDDETITGAPTKIVDHVGYDSGGAMAFVSISNTGNLVYNDLAVPKHQLSIVDRTGKELRKVGAPVPIRFFNISPDGTRFGALIENEKTAANDVLALDIERTVWSPVVVDRSPKNQFHWSSDSRTVYYNADRFGFFDIFRIEADSTGASELVLKTNTDKVLLFSPEPNVILFRVSNDPERVVYSYDTVTKRQTPLGLRGRLEALDLSPDQKLVAFVHIQPEPDPSEVYVASYPDGKRRVQISSGGGTSPTFSADGKTLYYHAAIDDTVRAVQLSTTGERVTPQGEQTFFKLEGRKYLGKAPDAERFFVGERETPVVRWPYFISNWRALIDEKP